MNKAADKSLSTVKNLTKVSISPLIANEALFQALLLEGEITAKLTAGHGADTNFMSRELLHKIMKKSSSTEIEVVNPSHLYSEINKSTSIQYYKNVMLGMYLTIKNGSSL